MTGRCRATGHGSHPIHNHRLLKTKPFVNDSVMSFALPSLAVPAPQPLAEQLLVLRRHWRLILACTMGFPALAALTLAALPASYSATGIVLYDPASATLPGSPPSTPEAALDEDEVTASQGAIIASLPAAFRHLQPARSGTKLGFRNDAPRARAFPFSLLPRPAVPSGTQLAETVQNRLGISVLPGSRVISISFTARSPLLAARCRQSGDAALSGP